MKILLGNCISNSDNYKLDYTQKQLVIKRISNAFKKHNITVKQIKKSTIKDNSLDELIWMRDIFIPIDNKYIIGNLTKKSSMGDNRSNEFKYVVPYLQKRKVKYYLPKNIKLEGGDIIQYNDFIFVGIGKRTNKDGYELIKNTFKNKIVIPIKHTALHLDCVFCVLDNGLTFYDSKYISNTKTYSINIPSCFALYDISDIVDSGKYLATNFVQVGNSIIISNTPQNKPFRDILEKLGYNLEIVDTENIWKEGGSIRCLTQWMY
jgi:N-dimethylarginine dimethylaminohydrolase